MIYKKIWLLLLSLIALNSWSQEALLKELENSVNNNNVYETAAFKGLKIVNFESTKLVSKKELYFIIAHRFGSVENGVDDLFGLDNASTRLQFIYGITDGINVGFSRSKFNKTYDFTAKYRLARQQKSGFPFTIVGYNLAAINTALDKEFLPGIDFTNRLGYTTQLLVSRKFSDKFSLQLMPTFFHDNYVANDDQQNSQIALGIGGRYKLTKRFSLNIDYGYNFNRAENPPVFLDYKNPLSIGVDIETGGHVFQLHFTNAQGMFENAFLGQASGDWSEGNIFFGFNISRVFDF